MLVISSKLDSVPAKNGDVKSAIKMIQYLNECIKERKPLDENARIYFSECFDAFLEQAEYIKTTKTMEPLITKCLKLNFSKGRPKNPPDKHFEAARKIYEIKNENEISVDKAIQILITDPKYKKIKGMIDGRALEKAYNRHLSQIEAWERFRNFDKLAVLEFRKLLKKMAE